jgi:hypothetical protein
MSGKAVISLTTGLEDPEKVTVAFLVAVDEYKRRPSWAASRDTAGQGVVSGGRAVPSPSARACW